MKQAALFLCTVFLFVNSCSLVLSQNAEQCNDVINFNGIVNFDTTAMFCQTVWRNKDYVLRYAQAGTELWSFLLSAPNTNSWLGLGFSTTGMMVGSSAMVGWIQQNGRGIAKQYLLQAKDPTRVTSDVGDLNVVLNSTAVFIQSNRIYLAFQLSTSQPRRELLYAVGPYGQLPIANSGFRLIQHRDRDSASLDYTTGRSQTTNRPYTGIRRTHGALNMIGWGILMPIGAIVARYFKQWDPMWFYTHAAIQTISFLLGLVGFFLGFVVQGYVNTEVTNHKNLGILILILGCLQVMALLIRPKKESKLRIYWNWYHHNVGRVMILFAISNIFYGIRLGLEGSGWYGPYAMILVLMLIAAIVLEIKLWTQR